MKEFKILHTGDWHVGSKRDGNADVIFHRLGQLVEAARMVHPDIVLVAGDIFDNAGNRTEWRMRAVADVIKELIEYTDKVIIIPGTPHHDSVEHFEWLKSYFRGFSSVIIVTEARCIKLFEPPFGNVYVACVPLPRVTDWENRYKGFSDEEIYANLTEKVDGQIRAFRRQIGDECQAAILVSHLPVVDCEVGKGFAKPDPKKETVIRKETLTDTNYDLVCLGHIHHPQKVKDCKNTFYCGAISKLFPKEQKEKHGFWIHTLYEDGKCYSSYVANSETQATSAF